MKKITLSMGCFVALAFQLSAQTIGSSWAPSPWRGNEIHYTENVSGVDAGSAGSGQTWNYASLSDDSVNVESIVPPAGQNSADMFPAASLASVIVDGDGVTLSSYFQASASAYTVLGASVTDGTTTGTFVYSNPFDLFRFPIGFGQSYSDDFESSVTALGFTYQRNGTVQVDVDGSGSLATPFGAFPEVLRVKSVETYQLIGLPPIPGVSTSGVVTTYNYISAANPGLLLMTYIIDDDNIGNVDTTIAFSNPNYVGIERVNEESFSMYPVPASSEVRISAGTPISNIELFDMNGRSAAVVAANGSTQAVIGV
ncbi:MAG: hypothetical protein KDC13_02475, partial [Bacteroidetes bacterium]|nr:hypothetical protein [Bacteroidota bacterium]